MGRSHSLVLGVVLGLGFLDWTSDYDCHRTGSDIVVCGPTNTRAAPPLLPDVPPSVYGCTTDTECEARGLAVCLGPDRDAYVDWCIGFEHALDEGAI